MPTKTTSNKTSERRSTSKGKAPVKQKVRAETAPTSRHGNLQAQRAPFALTLSIQWGDELDALLPRPVSHAQLRRWVKAALQSDASFTVRFVGATEGRSLNRDFRHKDYATNVLTFPHAPADVPWPPGVPRPAGADIVICWPVVLSEAKAQRKNVLQHLAHLVIHGCLHGQGYDHETDEQAEQMESLETRLLKRFRIADPYTTHG